MTDEALIERLAKVKDLPKLTVALIREVQKIPYVCGRSDCHAPGCQAIRDARDKIVEIVNR